MDDDKLNQPPQDAESEATDLDSVDSPKAPAEKDSASVTAQLPSGPPIATGSNVVISVSKGPATTAQATVTAPKVIGMRQDVALQELQKVGLEVQVLSNPNASFPDGAVSHQLPTPDAVVTKGSKVAIVVSSGPAEESAAMSVLPSVVGKSVDDAKALIASTQLKASVVEDYSASVPEGVVSAQEPNSLDLDREPEKKRSLLWLWILLLLALLAVGAYFLLSGGDAEQVTVPDLEGMLVEEAEAALDAAGLTIGKIAEEVSPDVPEGEVISQDPAAGDMADEGSRVNVVTAIGPGGVEIPDVTGMTASEAQSALEAEGFAWRADDVFSDDVAEGSVVEQSPKAGSRVEEGTEVALFVSKGPEPPPNATVPDVAGMTEANAKKALDEVGLKSQSVNSYSDAVPVGDVIAHAPASGSSVAPGTKVVLFISQGPRPPDVTMIEVPDVSGMSQDDAEKELKDSGFSVEVIEVSNDTVEAGFVSSQLPPGGTEAPEGSAVAILVSTGPPM